VAVLLKHFAIRKLTVKIQELKQEYVYPLAQKMDRVDVCVEQKNE